MKMVKKVSITPEQEVLMKQAYLRHNIKMGNRTLVILRDLETLSRLVNVIVATNFFNRSESEEKGIFKAEDVDIDKAIELWDNLIYLRLQMYQDRNEKSIMSTSEKIMSTLREMGRDATVAELIERVVSRNICSRRSLFRHLKKLEDAGIIQRELDEREDGHFGETFVRVLE